MLHCFDIYSVGMITRIRMEKIKAIPSFIGNGM